LAILSSLARFWLVLEKSAAWEGADTNHSAVNTIQPKSRAGTGGQRRRAELGNRAFNIFLFI
jgi:hypothetical protein